MKCLGIFNKVAQCSSRKCGTSSSSRALVVIAFLFMAPASNQATQLYELQFSNVVNGTKLPLSLYMETDGAKINKAFVSSPYWNRGLSILTPNLTYQSANVSGFVISSSSIKGSFTANIKHQSLLKDSFPTSINLDAAISSERIAGTYTGTTKGVTISGSVKGSVQNGIALSQIRSATFFMELGMPGATEVGYNQKNLGSRLFVKFDASGKPVQGSMAEADFYFTDSYPIPRPYPILKTYYTAEGDTAQTLCEEVGYMMDVLDLSGSIDASGISVQARVKITAVNAGVGPVVGTWIYKLACQALAGKVINGTYEIRNDTARVSSGTVLGHAGDNVTVPKVPQLSIMKLMPADPALAQGGFQGPYFQTVFDFQTRLYAHSLWLFNDPVLGGPFKSDFQAALMRPAGNKWYDNMPPNGYAGAAGMLLLHELAPDARLRNKAIDIATRAGNALLANRGGPFGLQTYYKGDFWFTTWAGRAYLDIYKLTKEKVWLEAAKHYAGVLRKTQRPSGTWTWVDEETGEIGVSNERNDRSYDNRDLQCSDFLIFLGRLRKEAGVTEFADVEQKAYAWMNKSVDSPPSYLWLDRRPGGDKEDCGPTLLALYMLDYAPSYDAARLNKLISWMETNLINWTRPTAVGQKFAPSVNGFIPRAQEYGPQTNAAAAARMALIYLKVYEKTNQKIFLEKAQALSHSVLAIQNPRTGLIHHLGYVVGDSHEQVINQTGNHNWSAYKAELGIFLLEYYRLAVKLRVITDGPVTYSSTPVKKPLHAVESTLPYFNVGVSPVSPRSGTISEYDFTGRLLNQASVARKKQAASGLRIRRTTVPSR